MSISIQCGGCQKKLKTKDELAGKRVKCPGCGLLILVPVALPASQPKAMNPALGKAPVPNKADGVTAPPLRKPRTAKKSDFVAVPSPLTQGGRVRWPWYAGGGAAALCVVAALVLVFA